MDFLSVGFEIKSEDVNADGIFRGYGSTFGGAPDSYGDIMEKGAFKKSLESGVSVEGLAKIISMKNRMEV